MKGYEVLLRVLPPGFRREFGDDMVRLFEDRLREAGPSRLGRGGVWAVAVGDVLLQAPGEWWRALGGASTGGGRLDRIVQDMRLAVRSLVRAPGFTLAAVLTLALCVGANAAVFSVVNTVLLRPLPYQQPDRLVAVWPAINFNTAMVARVAEAMPALESVSGVTVWSFTLTGGGEPEEVPGARVGANHFEVLGVPPLLGRTFVPDDAVPGNEGVVVLSHGLWTRRFGGDPEVVGRTIDLAGGDMDRHTVIGVMGPDFRPVAAAYDEPRFWVPLPMDPSVALADDNTWYVNHRVARLAPGATREVAEEQLRQVAPRIRAELRTVLSDEDVEAATVELLHHHQVADVSRALWLLLGLAGLVLLMGCANVANLLLARGESRVHDLAVRTALGAGRPRLVAQLLTESAVLGFAGCVSGVALAAGAVSWLSAAAPEALPRAREVAIEPAVIGFAAFVSVCAVLLFGTAPALRSVRGGAAGAIRSGARGTVGGSRRLDRALVGAQVALAVMVLAAAGLMLRTLRALDDVDPGFRSEGVVAFRVQPPQTRYPDAGAFRAYYDRVFARVRELGDVESAGGIQLLPGRYGNWSFPTFVEGHPVGADDSPPTINFRVVRPGYFETMAVPLLRGRLLDGSDREGAEEVALVNRAFVDRYWPGIDPVGQALRFFSATSNPVRVVGVVGDVRQHGLDREPRPEIYLPMEQYRWGAVSLWVVARTTGDPAAALTTIRDAVWEVDPDVPVSYLGTMDGVLADSVGQRRFASTLLSAFAVVALLLGAVGVYGVASYTVLRRVPELGLRMALGAPRGHVLGRTLASGMAPVAAGLVVGLAGAWGTAGLLGALLYEVEPRDPLTLAVVASVLAGAALAATARPAWRASRIDPSEALRSD